jgi:hypothetical protein
MKAMLGIFCIAILNPTSKNAFSFLLCLCLLFNKVRDKDRQVLPESEWEWWGEGQAGKMTQTMYARMTK